VVNPSGTFFPPKHGVEHHIITSGRPMTSRFRRLDLGKLQATKKEFEQIEADASLDGPAVVGLAHSTWYGSPTGAGGLVDYRCLNPLTRQDWYPVPNMTDLAARLHGCIMFTTLYLKKGHY
jgi:hypothetical protein